jgi:hypothetical protein
MKKSTIPHDALDLEQRTELASACGQLFGSHFTRALNTFDKPLRARILTAEIMLLSIVYLVVNSCESLLQLMDIIKFGKLLNGKKLNFTPTAFYNRLRKLPHELFLDMFRSVTLSLNQTSSYSRTKLRTLALFANEIYAIDDTTLDALMRKSGPLAKFKKGSSELLAGRLGCAIDLNTQKFAEVMYESDAMANEKNHFWPLVERLGAGNLFVFDLGYFSFELFDRLTESYSYFITPMRKKTSYIVMSQGANSSNYRDSIIYLGKYKADRAAWPLRLVEIRINGEWYGYLTNVLMPQQLRADAIWRLYKERWTIEKAFSVFKRALGGAWLHSCHLNGVLIQVWSTLSVYQVFQDLRLDISVKRKMDIEDISWVNLIRRIAMYVSEPVPGQTLREWLTNPKLDLLLAKRGTRKRSPDKLPKPLLKDIRSFCSEREVPPWRKPRHGKPEPRTKKSLIIMAGIAP